MITTMPQDGRILTCRRLMVEGGMEADAKNFQQPRDKLRHAQAGKPRIRL